ncbi:hypothetical protein OWV82_003220 [Melia azedarach]|uniref:Uncharacterized protein n=1 Tax=Melia azedarach TaxID=155640 RepID=A0ACC1YK83_MELAZ|nr:hypothetical protein OWV82_003220 [Melia azedarach]
MGSDNSHTSINVESLETSLQGELAPSSKEYCIYRVPKRLRQANERDYISQLVSILGPFHDGKEDLKAMEETKLRYQQNIYQSNKNDYTPQIVSIGPYHHGSEELKAMEVLKRRYLQHFLQRTEVSLGGFLEYIKENEAKIRSSYAQIIEFDSQEFVRMILVDAAFIIEVFLKFYFFDKSNAGDPLFDKPWLIIDVKHDIFLLENQLPFFILKGLFEKADLPLQSKRSTEKLSMIEITLEFCKYYWDFFGVLEENLDVMIYSEALHLVDFLRTFITPPGLEKEKRPETLTMPSVKKLYQAGVKFHPITSSKISLFDIRFNKGVLEIPLIKIRPSMEILLKNLLAFEQCHCYDSLISDYVIVMSYLVDTGKDVDLLVEKKIIEHRLRNNEAVSTLFHNFIQGFRLDLEDFYFTSLVKNLDSYCNNPLHKWKANLKQDYFKTPWASASVIAAVILLVLTFIQTVCSILQVQPPQSNTPPPPPANPGGNLI